MTQLYYKNQGMFSREWLPVSNVYALLKITPLVYVLITAKASNFPLKSPLGSALRFQRIQSAGLPKCGKCRWEY